MSTSSGQDEVKAYLSQVDDLYGILAVQSENGLFNDLNMDEYEKLKDYLGSARQFLRKNPAEVTEAIDQMQDFYRTLNLAERKRGLMWRLSQSYAIPAWLYLTVSPFALSFVVSHSSILASLKLVNGAFWGGVGGVAQGYYWLWQRVSNRQFRGFWVFWILALPAAGAIFGAMAYMLLAGGLVSITTGSNAGVNEYVALVFAASAGFAWKDFVVYISGLWQRTKTKG